MDSEELKKIPSIGQDRRCRNTSKRVLVVVNGFQEIRTPTKSDVPARDARKIQVYMYNVRWNRKLGLLSVIEIVKNNVYQQENNF
jgi:hypothetical protein